MQEFRVYLWANKNVYIDVWASSAVAACRIVQFSIHTEFSIPPVLGAVPKLWQVTELETGAKISAHSLEAPSEQEKVK